MFNSKLKTQNSKLKGQALLELATFGSILIMLLGILVNYGLRYNFQQQVMQQAFRKALESAAESVNSGTPISDSQVVIQDRHIPDPANPFGVGAVTPFSSSASVTRNYKLQETPETEEELPVVTLNIPGREPLRFKTAGFREESDVPGDSIPKYEEIYGSNNVWETGDGECLEWEINPNTGEEECVESGKNLKIIDSAAGEIISYDATVRQCRQIVDEEAFIKECERGKPDGSTDCSSLASQPMNVPWYCENFERMPNSEASLYTYSYTFPVLDQLFNFAIAQNKPKSMGLQQDYTQTTSMDNVLRKQETGSGITTTDTLDWQVDTQRTIVYRPYSDTSGGTTQQEVASAVSQQKTEERKTPWYW